MIHVDSADDPRLLDYRDLRDPARRVAVEGAAGFFVGEGELVVRRMVERGVALRSVLVTPRRHDALADVLDGLDAPVYVAPDPVLRSVVGFDLHRGAVAAADRPPARDADPLVRAGGARSVALALERVNDHENLGSLFRSAAALGAAAVLLDPECSDPLYRRSVRVSMGHVLSVPWARTGALPAAVARWRAAGARVVALTPGGDTALGAFATARGAEPAVLLLGAEGPGLRAETLAAADDRVAIPMTAGSDSLNVAVAAAIALFTLADR